MRSSDEDDSQSIPSRDTINGKRKVKERWYYVAFFGRMMATVFVITGLVFAFLSARTCAVVDLHVDGNKGDALTRAANTLFFIDNYEDGVYRRVGVTKAKVGAFHFADNAEFLDTGGFIAGGEVVGAQKFGSTELKCQAYTAMLWELQDDGAMTGDEELDRASDQLQYLIMVSQWCAIVAASLAVLGLLPHLVEWCMCNTYGSCGVASILWIVAAMVQIGALSFSFDPDFCFATGHKCTFLNGWYFGVFASAAFFLAGLFLCIFPRPDPVFGTPDCRGSRRRFEERQARRRRRLQRRERQERQERKRKSQNNVEEPRRDDESDDYDVYTSDGR